MLNAKQLFLPVQPQDQVVSLCQTVVLTLPKLYVKQPRQLISEITVFGIPTPVDLKNVLMPLQELLPTPHVIAI